MRPDHYLTLAGEGHSQLREKASRFIAYAFPIRDEAHFKERLEAIAGIHHDSRHLCYAWVLGSSGERHRANDAGEPNGTAGRPILIRIQGAGLTQCAVVVVRYFGGTLLGKAGLVKAYGEAAAMALQDAGTSVELLRQAVRVVCSYAQLEALRAQVIRASGEVLHVQYDAECTLDALVACSLATELIDAWSAQGMRAEMVQPLK